MEALNEKGISNSGIPLRLDVTGQLIEFHLNISLKHHLMPHVLSCKNGDIITLRHNEERDITSDLLDEVCVDVRKEPILQEVNNEDLPEKANKSKEARLDISTLNLWTTGQQAFFDVRVSTSSLRDIVRWQLRSASEQMRTKRKEAMAIIRCKLKMGPSLSWSLLQMAVWEKNAFGLTKD